LRLDNSTAKPTVRPGEVFWPGFIRTVREGSDVTLAAAGGILGEALLAADQLAEQGVRCRVLSVHTVKPLDTATLSIAAAETQGIVSIEEHAVDGGLRNTFSSVVGSQAYLRTVYSIDAASIVRTVSLKLGIAEEAISR
jgi:transketolase